MRVEKVAHATEGCARGADIFIAVSDARPHSPVGLATGETMRGLYQELANRSFQPHFEDVFLLDEYLGLPDNSPHTFEHEIRTRFCEPLGYSGRVHVPGHGDYRGEEGAQHFEEELLRRGPVSVQLLGLGTNGHIAFNEPGSEHDSLTRVVLLAEETREANQRHFPPNETMPTHAVSQGLRTIQRASTLLLLVFGPSKQPALLAALTEEDPVHPLRALLDHPGLILVTDIDLPEKVLAHSGR